MSKSKTKFTFAQLALVDWLAEDSKSRFAVVSTDHFSSKSISLYQVINNVVTTVCSPSYGCSDIALLDRLGGSLVINYSPLVNEQALVGNHRDFTREDKTANGFDKFMTSLGYSGFDTDGGGLLLLRQTPSTLQWWEDTGKNAFATLKAKRDKDRIDAGRTVIIGAECQVYPHIDKEIEKAFPIGFRHPIPNITLIRPTWKARVVRETKDRLYIHDVVRIRDVDTKSRERQAVRDSAPNEYVNRSDVLIDGASETAAETLVSIDQDRIAAYRNACDTALAAALEPLLALHARLLQAEAMHDDVMREAIEAGRAKV
jgi:hypothetical protein